MSTKAVIAQNVMAHEAIYRLSKLLDQLCSGMEKSPVLRLIRAFPEIFSALLTYTGNVSVEEVQEAVYVCNDEMCSEDKVIMKFLRLYINQCSTKGKLFMVAVLVNLF